ncbi:hypothetical protein FIM08_04095, partial [SAR202 cluster bacterium AC-647-N09_OGT_505m]|nr:hypothetical protein [SAR202 cluster bacterium AC-647-N09_OGT_505m]
MSLLSPEYNLLSNYPDVAKQWHSGRNSGMSPRRITPFSSQRVWWLCDKGHEWQAAIGSRTRNGRGCPYCAGQRPTIEHNLLSNYPDVARQWHPTRNEDKKPEDFRPKSGKKVWWLCDRNHEWPATISHRTNDGRGCQYCAGQKVSAENNMLAVHPEVASQWHPTRNGTDKPEHFTSFTHRKAWWLCEKGHEWQAAISSRSSGRQCPYCTGRKVSSGYNLLDLYPEAAKQWHPTKNGTDKPQDFLPKSPKFVWWLCEKGHETIARVYTRTGGRPKACDSCFNKSSIPEIRLLSELEYVFGKVEHRKKLHGMEVDIYVRAINVGVEYDGGYFHSGKEKADGDKVLKLRNKGIKLLRVRHESLRPIPYDSVMVSDDLTKDDVNRLLNKMEPVTNNTLTRRIERYIESPRFLADDYFKKYLAYFPSPFPEDSLLTRYPQLSEEWHPTKNPPLSPRDVSFASNRKAWWLCHKGHEWEAIINSRARAGRGCPYCSGRMPTPEHNLLVVFPDVAAQWHPTRNGTDKPSEYCPSSNKKFWWLCNKGHEWERTINGRTSKKGTGCPVCFRRTIRGYRTGG